MNKQSDLFSEIEKQANLLAKDNHESLRYSMANNSWLSSHEALLEIIKAAMNIGALIATQMGVPPIPGENTENDECLRLLFESEKVGLPVK